METIHVQNRDFTVKAKQMRRLGMVPGNVVGKSLQESISIQMDEAVARRLFRFMREGSKLQLDIDGRTLPVQIKERTLNPINKEILHLSFQALTADERVNSVIHIILENDEKVAGLLEKMMLEIPYASLPADMIDTITVNLDGVPSGTVLTVGDLPELKNDKIELQTDPESIILRISDRKHQAAEPTEE